MRILKDIFLLLLILIAFDCTGKPDTEPPVSLEVDSDTKPEPNELDGEFNIKGKVTDADGGAVAGVVVSDGSEVVQSDIKGNYRLKSDKNTGFVFISIPGNYKSIGTNGEPGYYKKLLLPENYTETHNFTLLRTNQEKYSIIITADQHLANRTEDLKQFRNKVLPDIQECICNRGAAGSTVYGISLGDIGWEQYWRANNFDLSKAAAEFLPLDMKIFHCIGNHDNNPYVTGDWESSNVFREVLGPNYYSFNIGKIHFVMLDNVIYNNPGASETSMGDRSYDRAVTDRQLEWLRKDLAMIPDKSTPLVICGHVPFMSDPTLNGGFEVVKRNLLNMEEIEKVLAGFSDVTFFSGHYHRNYTVESPFQEGFKEYNVASLSGSLWWTGHSTMAGNHICTDGTPGGYGILDVEGNRMKYRYKSVGYDESYQFRLYDLNRVQINEQSLGNAKYKEKVKDYADSYYTASFTNDLLINVFNWGPRWKIEILENGVPLEVSRVRVKDPLHILSYEIQRLENGAIPTATSTFTTQYSSHFFKARAKRADTPVTVRVTDATGRVYQTTTQRPKAFSLTMN